MKYTLWYNFFFISQSVDYKAADNSFIYHLIGKKYMFYDQCGVINYK